MGDYYKKIKKYIKEPGYRFSINARAGLYDRMSDEQYLKMTFKTIVGYDLDLDHVETFTEKMQWIKLNDRKPVYTTMVDKYAAKDYVAGMIGREHIIPTIGVWNHFNEIDFTMLPQRFVLKTTHNSGGVIVCRDKKVFNISAAKKRIDKNLSFNYYKIGREWPYKNVPPRVIAEEYMEDTNSPELIDYKFFCFDGEPLFLYVSQGMSNHITARMSFVTFDWELAPYERKDYRPFEILPPKPTKFNEMVELSKILSKGHAFLRVDLYEINETVYFSELTLTPCGGFIPFKSLDQDRAMGKLLKV